MLVLSVLILFIYSPTECPLTYKIPFVLLNPSPPLFTYLADSLISFSNLLSTTGPLTQKHVKFGSKKV